MPCTDPYADQEAAREYHKRCTKIEAMLCAVVTAIQAGDGIDLCIQDVNWKEAGVTKEEFLAWYEEHKQNDRERLAQEQREADRKSKAKKLAAKLYSALSSDEVKLLAKFGIEAIQKYAEDEPAKKRGRK